MAATVLEHFDVNLNPLRKEVEALLDSQPHRASVDKLPQSQQAKDVVTHAVEEARTLGHNYIGTEHLLLGLMCDGKMISAQVLTNLGLQLSAVRDEVQRLAPPSHS